MADDFNNSPVPRPAAAPSPDEIAGSFKGVRELASPVVRTQAASLVFYTIPAYSDKELALLPVFTDPGRIKPPYAAKPPLTFLRTLFTSLSAGAFAFNPQKGPYLSTGEKRTLPSEARLTRLQLSTVIGFLQTSSFPPAGTQEAAIKQEAGLGNLHRANYLASALLAGNPSAPPYGLYAEILINLGLLQEAYDHIKTAQTPEFFYYRAFTLRLSGDTAKARHWLEKIPAGTPFENKKSLELAWLALEEGKTDEALAAFRTLSEKSFEKAGALFGLGSALMKKALTERNPAGADDILNAFSAALKLPSPLIPEILMQLGNHKFRAGDHAGAAECYRKAAALRPSIQASARLTLALIKTGNLPEAAGLINEIALTDPDSAGKLATELPRDTAAGLLEAARQHQEAPAAPGIPEPPPPSSLIPHPSSLVPPPAPRIPSPPPPPPSVSRPAESAVMASLEATPVRDITSAPGARPPEDIQPPSSLIPHPSSLVPPLPSEAETRKDDFMGRAFKLASSLEDEFNKKIYFNADGLAEVEKKLRLTFLKARQNPQEAVETVKDCSAFLCFLLQGRFKGRLVKLPDFDHWGWPMVFDVPKHVITYPVERVWKLLWKGDIPEPGWLAKYLQYVEDELRSGKLEPPQGAAAVLGRITSHPERLADARIEHRRIMILTATLEETTGIELDRAGILKLEKALKDKFKPDIPPTADGWKLLRCYGHILAEIAAKNFKAAWYNTDGGDGFWSMRLPWGTFIFPIGKIYKTAANRESLGEYYNTLLADKLRAANGGMS